MNIPILMTVDRNFISQERVAIWSACISTSKDVMLDIAVLTTPDLDFKSRDRLLSLMEIFENLKIRFVEIDEKDFINARGSLHIAIASYYRLIASKVVNEDKCIYLDGDLIVECNLLDLFEIDLEDYYVAGVPDINMIMQPNLSCKYAEECGIIDFSDYINAGVMVMNLKKMREDNLLEKFLKEANEGNNLFLDQDVINRVCHRSIKLIDWNFNKIAWYSDKTYKIICGHSEKNYIGRIIHWAGPQKPWHDFTVKNSKKWWEKAYQALEQNCYHSMYEKAEHETNSKFYSYIIKKCKNESNIIIFGYSDNGYKLYIKMRGSDVNGNIVFCDNNIKKQEMNLSKEKILSVGEAVNKYPEAIIINTVTRCKNEVRKQLNELGVNDNRIVDCAIPEMNECYLMDKTFQTELLNNCVD